MIQSIWLFEFNLRKTSVSSVERHELHCDDQVGIERKADHSSAAHSSVEGPLLNFKIVVVVPP